METSYTMDVRNLNAYSWLFNYSAFNWNNISNCVSVKNLPKHKKFFQFLKKTETTQTQPPKQIKKSNKTKSPTT